MADTKISALTDGATADASDRIPLARSPFASGDNRYLTPAYIGTYLAKNTLAAGTITTDQPHAITQTWNAGGVTFTGMKSNITDTASAAGSLLMDLQVAGSSKCSVSKVGTLQIADSLYVFNGTVYAAGVNLSNSLTLESALPINWNSDTYLRRDGAANVLALRNSTTAQTYRIYNTWTDASNYERGFAQWSGNVFQIGSANAGTGTARNLEFVSAGGAFTLTSGTITTSQPMSLTQTWNAGGVAFTGFKVNATSSASAAASLLMDLQLDGSSIFSVRKDGYTLVGTSLSLNGTSMIIGHNSAVIGMGASNDVLLYWDAANTLALRNSTNAQTFRIYNTWTDASNYERGFAQWSGNVFQIGSANAGTGTARNLEFVSAGGAFTLTSGTITTSQPMSLTQTWNAGGVTFTAFKVNATLTASAAASLLMDVQADGASKLSVRKDGYVLVGGIGLGCDTFYTSGGGTVMTVGTVDSIANSLNVAGNAKAANGTATPAGGSTTARITIGTTSGFGIYIGSGAPTVSAAQGSIYLRSDGSSTSTRMYVNTNGSTTWTNVTTAA